MQLPIIKVIIMRSSDCFSRIGTGNTVGLSFVFVEILYQERLFIVNKGNFGGLKADQGERM